jgi:hypothetical protein
MNKTSIIIPMIKVKADTRDAGFPNVKIKGIGNTITETP